MACIRDTEDDLPGIASGLRKQLLEIYTRKRNPLFCAALKADEYFERPTLDGYKELKKACIGVKGWNKVRPAIITYLNTGIFPKFGSPQWPLPETGIFKPRKRSWEKPPYYGDLLEIALYEKNIDEALRLYDANKSNSSKHSHSLGIDFSDAIAEAVKDKYPERSIAIWETAAQRHIAQTSPREYAVAVGYLNRIMKTTRKIGKEKEFLKYIDSLKAQNTRKIRLIEMLNGLSGKRIIDE